MINSDKYGNSFPFTPLCTLPNTRRFLAHTDGHIRLWTDGTEVDNPGRGFLIVFHRPHHGHSLSPICSTLEDLEEWCGRPDVIQRFLGITPERPKRKNVFARVKQWLQR